jgi:hypothetical protein
MAGGIFFRNKKNLVNLIFEIGLIGKFTTRYIFFMTATTPLYELEIGDIFIVPQESKNKKYVLSSKRKNPLAVGKKYSYDCSLFSKTGKTRRQFDLEVIKIGESKYKEKMMRKYYGTNMPIKNQ